MTRAVWPCVLIAFGVSLFFHWLQFDAQLDWSDEGFLWYGVRHVLTGQVPLRDFQSYDPLRYYWGAFFSPLFGGGLFGLRHAAWLFQAVTLSFGLLALRRVTRGFQSLLLAAVLIVLWQFWHFRFFDAGWMMVAIYFAARLLESPNRSNHAAAGALTGVSAFLGVNHGLYLFCAFLALMLTLEIKKEPAKPRPAAFFAGLVAGAAPLIVMLLFLPGFWEKYLERVAWYAHNLLRGRSDISLAVPWPWTVSWELVTRNPKGFTVGLLHYVNVLTQGLAFVSLIAIYLGSAWAVLRMPKGGVAKNPLFVASFFVGAFYVNHVFARGDITHLGEGFFPLLALAVSSAPWLRSAGARALRAWLVALTITAAVPLSVLFLKAMVAPQSMTLLRVGRDHVWMFKRDAAQVHSLKAVVAGHVRPEEPLFIAPMLTTLYNLTGRTSPTHQIYFFREEPARVQRRVLEELERNRVNWAIVGDVAIDGRPELTFSYTNPLLADYLFENFEPVTARGLPAGHLLLRRRGA